MVTRAREGRRADRDRSGAPAPGSAQRRPRAAIKLSVAALAALLALAALGATQALAADPVVAAAGDIACSPHDSNFAGGSGTSSYCRQKYTSNLLVNAGLSAVLPLGDIQYDCASASDFAGAYDPTWGRVKSITRPAPGNHEYKSSNPDDYGYNVCASGAKGYYDYFGAAAGDRTKGYYSFNVGTWHLIALNTNTKCSKISCSKGSAQEQWLKNDLAASTAKCTLAYWHEPLFSAKGGYSNARPFWDTLYAADADVVLNAHVHHYQRFVPQTPSGSSDSSRGIREFIVGTGGKSTESLGSTGGNLQVQLRIYGVLKLTLHPTSYDWQFVSQSGSVLDSGSTACHGSGSTGDTQAPTAPSNLRASAASSTRMDLTWSASSDNVAVAGYDIYRNGSPIATNVPATSFSDTTVSPSTSYSYHVKARDAAGNASLASNTATATTPASGTPNTIELSADADARVEEASPSTNYGTSYLRTNGGSEPDVETYLRFNVTGVLGTVSSAKLRVYVYSGTVDGPAVYGALSSWTESGVKWTGRPARTSSAVADKWSIASNSWVEYDVTPLVAGTGTYTFDLAQTSIDGTNFYSREASDASLRPKLVLTLS